jgi:hypothetical protein
MAKSKQPLLTGKLPTHSAVHPHYGRRSAPAVPTGYKPDPYHEQFPKKPPTKTTKTDDR